ncbi:MAG: peptidylprolyl isomerase [Deltaproteobacteria bacterium]|nr:peptidylprolyl isomerase [Deltaproteobacteria bacterium]
MPRRALLGLLFAVLLAAPGHSDEVLVDGIAAQVGNNIVLISEVMQIVAPSERRLRAEGAPAVEIAKLRAEGLETMIEWRLIERVVRDTELFATDAEVDETIESIAGENGLTLDQLRQSVVTQDMSYQEYRQEIKRELERRKVVNAMVAAQVHVEEYELEDLYRERHENQPKGGTEVHLRQLLVPAGKEVGRSLEESCDLVRKIRQQIVNGEPFEELARLHSAAAPQHGGDIGWLHTESMADWMIDLIEPLEAGQITQVMELPFGCTIIKLVERKKFEPISYEQAKPMLQMAVFEMKVAEEYHKWMEELRDHTFIERRGYFADAAQFGQSPFRGRPEQPGDARTP